MTKVAQNFVIWAGDDQVLRFGISGSSGSGQDMAGNTASWILTDEANSGSLVSASGAISGSLVDVVISGSDDTAGLSGTYYYQLAATASGSAMTLAVGVATIHRSNF